MSFTKRAINLQFIINNGSLEGATPLKLDLTGHRCECLVTNPGASSMVEYAQLRVFGMKLEDMNRFSTNGLNSLIVRNDQVTISAGDVDGKISQIFQGTIFSAYIDFSTAPEASFNISATSGLFPQATPIPAFSQPNEIDVATVMETLATQGGYGFSDPNHVNVKLSNQYLSGTILEQIKSLAYNAGIACSIHNNIVSIWENGQTINNETLQISAETGMIGYPAFNQNGIQLKTLFNPDITNGQKVHVTSILPKANGDWYSFAASHELSTLSANGAWFSTLNLSQEPIYASKF